MVPRYPPTPAHQLAVVQDLLSSRPRVCRKNGSHAPSLAQVMLQYGPTAVAQVPLRNGATAVVQVPLRNGAGPPLCRWCGTTGWVRNCAGTDVERGAIAVVQVPRHNGARTPLCRYRGTTGGAAVVQVVLHNQGTDCRKCCTTVSSCDGFHAQRWSVLQHLLQNS